MRKRTLFLWFASWPTKNKPSSLLDSSRMSPFTSAHVLSLYGFKVIRERILQQRNISKGRVNEKLNFPYHVLKLTENGCPEADEIEPSPWEWSHDRDPSRTNFKTCRARRVVISKWRRSSFVRLAKVLDLRWSSWEAWERPGSDEYRPWHQLPPHAPHELHANADSISHTRAAALCTASEQLHSQIITFI